MSQMKIAKFLDLESHALRISDTARSKSSPVSKATDMRLKKVDKEFQYGYHMIRSQLLRQFQSLLYTNMQANSIVTRIQKPQFKMINILKHINMCMSSVIKRSHQAIT